MARPTKNADRRRSRHVIFRLTEREYARLHAKATLAGLSPNELARRLTCKGKRNLVIKTHRRLDPAFLKRIDRIGQNLNQLVESAHIFGRVAPEVRGLCNRIDALITQAIQEVPDDS